MRLSLRSSARSAVHGQIKLARLLELPESDVEERVRKLEQDELFRRLMVLGVVAVESDARARIAARGPGVRGLRVAEGGAGVAELLDGRGELVRLIARVGQERFTECFLGEERLADRERARRCGLSVAQARLLREAVDRLYVQSEFQAPPEAVPAQVYSAVAGVAVERGEPVLAFFHRDVWKSRYRVNEDKRRSLSGALTPREARRVEALLKELGLIEWRKSTLFRVLEVVMKEQAEFLVSRDPRRRRSLTQRSLAEQVDADPSVINRLIANKSVELPWGLQAPLRVFVPSAKAVLRDHLDELARQKPELSDEALRIELLRRHAARLSRRSVTQYRKELGLGARGRRGKRPG